VVRAALKAAANVAVVHSPQPAVLQALSTASVLEVREILNHLARLPSYDADKVLGCIVPLQDCDDLVCGSGETGPGTSRNEGMRA
jgi:hypothetical protein